MDSENPCCTFTAAVPVDQRARRAGIPGEPVTERDSLFRREFLRGRQRMLKLQVTHRSGAVNDQYSQRSFLHLVGAATGPPLYMKRCRKALQRDFC